MDRLAGKVAIITGGALGIGAACARIMAEAGAGVAILDTQDSSGSELARDLSREGHKVRFWRCDVSQEEQVEASINDAARAFGRLDILVNNAGVSGANKPTHELSEAEWDFVQAVNVKGVFFCTKHSIAHLRAAGGGSIINISSVYGLVGAGDVPPYHASKGAVRLMTKNDALIYAPDRIRVNSIHPGFIWTPMVEHHLSSLGDVEAQKDLVAQLHPLGHLGEASDIAWGAVYLAADEARFVTGAELVIDGGYTAR